MLIPSQVLGDALLALLLVIIIVFVDTLTKWTANIVNTFSSARRRSSSTSSRNHHSICRYTN
nr:MAG TPA: hypothetical protein [Caudoviricetes sp.]